MITYIAGSSPASSSAYDGIAANAGAEPTRAAPSAIPSVRRTVYLDYIRFDTTRRLAPGTADRFKITKGTTHDLAWAQYTNGKLAATPLTGSCTLKLPGKDDSTTTTDPVPPANCPVSKRDSTTDSSRQQDCSPGITTKCYDAVEGLYKNSLCSAHANSACGQWVQKIGGSEYYANGCILQKYCGTVGDYKDNYGTNYRCPDKTTPPPVVDPEPENPSGRQGTKCSLAEEVNSAKPTRVKECSTFVYCTSRTTGLADNTICPDNERCGRYIWKSRDNNPLAYLDACILRRYCGIRGAELSSGAAGGTYSYTSDFECPDLAVTPDECQNGQIKVGNEC